MSLRKDSYTWVWVYGSVFLIACAIVGVILSLSRPQVTLRLGDGVFNASIASTPTTREKGLSGTKQLAESNALLFVFKDSRPYGVWMKDMHYAIDIVWLNDAKRVVHVERNVQPDSYPKTYTPKANARYIIEFTAGTVDRKAIRLDSLAHFETSNIGEVQ